MAVGGALGTSARAMNAHSHHMDTIGGNIANINTTSYKEIQTQYQDFKVGASPRGAFLSVKTVDLRRVEKQGPITPSGRSLDVAINGTGFFVTRTSAQDGGETRYTRDGSFTGVPYTRETDSDGDGEPDQGAYLISSSGDYVLGYRADDDGAFAETLEPIDYSNTALDPGRPTSRITVRGNVPNTGGLEATHGLGVQVVRQVTTPAGATQTEVNDIRVTLASDQANENGWILSAAGGGDSISSVTVAPNALQFLGNGLVAEDAESEFTMDIAYADGGAQQVTLDLSAMTQYSGDQDLFVQAMTQDGIEASRLEDVFFDAQGVLIGLFSNNNRKPLYQLPLAAFPAQHNLEAIGGNAFRQTQASGEPELIQLQPGDGLAQIVGGALEQSAVVLESQFSRMITAQRAYSTAATAFRTSDEMLQEARNLKD